MFEQLLLFDTAFLHAMQSFSGPALDTAMKAITLLGNPVFWILIAAFLYWQGREKNSFHLITVMALSALFAGLVKNIFMRPRPSPQEFNVIGTDSFETFSFPSGHATLISSIFFFMRKKLSAILQIVFVIAIVLVSFSRMYLGLHYLSDVIAGLVLGAIIGSAYFAFVQRAKKTLHLTSKRDSIAIIFLLGIAVLFVGWLSSIPLGTALIGYYLGFFLLKRIGLHEKKLSSRKQALKQLLGFIGLGLIASTIIFLPDFQIIEYGFIGFWISFLWPAIFEQAIGHD